MGLDINLFRTEKGTNFLLLSFTNSLKVEILTSSEKLSRSVSKILKSSMMSSRSMKNGERVSPAISIISSTLAYREIHLRQAQRRIQQSQQSHRNQEESQ